MKDSKFQTAIHHNHCKSLCDRTDSLSSRLKTTEVPFFSRLYITSYSSIPRWCAFWDTFRWRSLFFPNHSGFQRKSVSERTNTDLRITACVHESVTRGLVESFILCQAVSSNKPFGGLSCGSSERIPILPERKARSSKSLSSNGLFWSYSSARGTDSCLPFPTHGETNATYQEGVRADYKPHFVLQINLGFHFLEECWWMRLSLL